MNKVTEPHFDLTSLGAAETVTGSKHLLNWEDKTFLIDCGLYQGQETKGLKEWDYERFDQGFIHSIDAIFLTHAHLDHCGYLPKLVRDGYQGPIYATKATIELAEIVMRDAAKIAQNNARSANKKITKESKKEVALYQTIHVEQTLKLFKVISFNKPLPIGPFEITFQYAGHIPGASSVSIKHVALKHKVTFSGDLGRSHDPLLHAPDAAKESTYLVVETTYGDRLHPDHNEEKAIEELAEILRRIKNKNAPLLIAAFSVQRTQLLFYYLNEVFKKFPDLRMPIFADSPMATAVGQVFRHSDEYLKIKNSEITAIFENIQEVSQKWDRENMDKMSTAHVIVSSSGMMTGGFVTEHFKAIVDNKDATLYLPGYMGSGTLGRKLADGAKGLSFSNSETETEIKCQVIHSHLYSAHADQGEILKWIQNSSPVDHCVGVTLIHGEPGALEEMRTKLDALGYKNVHIQAPASMHRVIL